MVSLAAEPLAFNSAGLAGYLTEAKKGCSALVLSEWAGALSVNKLIDLP